MKDVIAFGTPVMDLLINIDEQLPPNGSCYANEFSWQYGGKVSTGIVAVKMLCPESRCAMMGKAGGVFGRHIINDFKLHDIDISRLIYLEKMESPFSVNISIKADDSRNFYVRQSDFRRPDERDVDAGFAAGCRYMYIGDARPGTRYAAECAAKGGAKIVYDADNYTEGVEQAIALSDYLIPSLLLYQAMFGDGDMQGNLHRLRDMAQPGAVVIVTLGAGGLAGLDENGIYFEQPGYDIQATDTTGAGDVFHGAFIAGLLRGMDVRQSAQYGQAAAAIKCTRIGGRAGIPTHDVVIKYMQTGKIDYTEIDRRVERYAHMPVNII